MMTTGNLLDKQENRIRRMFGEIAPKYDFLNHVLSFQTDRIWRWRMTRLIQPRVNGPILDLCTGTGDLAFAYQRKFGKDRAVVGADFCHEMLVIAREKTDTRQLNEKMKFLEADAQHLPFADDSFALTTVSFGLRNITDTDRGIAEMTRVTKPGGTVAILEFSRPRNPVFGRVYRFYFKSILPKIGQMVSRSKDSAYHYLPASVMDFPDYEMLTTRMEEQGLVNCRYKPFTFGIATLYWGTKPENGWPSN
jgi:demethylmenaquinone methyltransferase / 2-methoxy-6-polyprenyl-1,4-benzoquinol methylase